MAERPTSIFFPEEWFAEGTRLADDATGDSPELRVAKSALRASQGRYSRLVERLGERFVLFSHTADEEQKTLYVSAACATVFGFPAEHALGRHWAELISWNPGVVERTLAAQNEWLSSGREFMEVEMSFRHPDGGVRIISVKEYCWEDESNRKIIEGIIEDITDQRKSEMALEPLGTHDDLTGPFDPDALIPGPRNTLRDLIGFVPAVLYEYVVYEDDSNNSEFLYLGPNCAEVLGRPSTYFMEDMDRFWGMVHPDDLTRLISESDAARAGGKFFLSEVRFIRANQEEVWLQLSSRPTITEEHGATIWAGYIIDVTKRKRAEAQLAASQRKYQRLIENLGDRFVAFSLAFESNKLHYVSDGFQTIFGVPASAAVSQDFTALIDWSNESRIQMQQNKKHLITGEESHQHYEYVFTHPNQSERYITITSHLAKNEDGLMVIEGIIENITYKKEIELELQDAATHDSLTWVLNRKEIFRALEQEYKRAMRYSRPLSLLVLDLDHFKRINDTYGHACGDEALVTTSQSILNSVRVDDVAGRYGGEEFLILLPETSLEDAVNFAERVRQEVEGLMIHWYGEVIRLTVSIGIASIDDSHLSAHDLFVSADSALYQAKVSGRNRVKAYNKH